MTDYLAVLKERGFIAQLSDEEGIAAYLSASERAFCYCGFDPTAESLHVGHLIPIMALAWFERSGHRPIALLGTGTTLIGDPSGRTELRRMLSAEDINRNGDLIHRQLARYLHFSDTASVVDNNARWLCGLEYIPFLREIGRHFSVNRMLAAECYKARLENGLSFIEFNYMLLQAYDFLRLSGEYGCMMQIGGNDQWGNILAGVDLIHRVADKQAYAITFPLITTASGAKMGKTAAGAVWLDPARTSPYEYYQFWRNTEDADVGRFLALFTFLPMDEIARLAALKDEECNEAKKILAFEACAITHGREAAELAADWKTNMPTGTVTSAQLAEGFALVDALVLLGACTSKGEARRLIQQGGIQVNDAPVTAIDAKLSAADAAGGEIIIRAGKKKYFRMVIS
ncbi:MAG: tyrosine--tRNA ligase [Spirochaetota bacterium]|jgi:tyrosyl-tRNA synthetase|nr:tyrosine--tRNA ligase [Spirochaetota bacterium]